MVQVFGDEFGSTGSVGSGEDEGVPEGNFPAGLFVERGEQQVERVLNDRPRGVAADNPGGFVGRNTSAASVGVQLLRSSAPVTLPLDLLVSTGIISEFDAQDRMNSRQAKQPLPPRPARPRPP